MTLYSSHKNIIVSAHIMADIGSELIMFFDLLSC